MRKFMHGDGAFLVQSIDHVLWDGGNRSFIVYKNGHKSEIFRTKEEVESYIEKGWWVEVI